MFAGQQGHAHTLTQFLDDGRFFAFNEQRPVDAADSQVGSVDKAQLHESLGEKRVPRNGRMVKDIIRGDAADETTRVADFELCAGLLDHDGAPQSIVRMDEGVQQGFAHGHFRVGPVFEMGQADGDRGNGVVGVDAIGKAPQGKREGVTAIGAVAIGGVRSHQEKGPGVVGQMPGERLGFAGQEQSGHGGLAIPQQREGFEQIAVAQPDEIAGRAAPTARWRGDSPGRPRKSRPWRRRPRSAWIDRSHQSQPRCGGGESQ